LPKSQLELPILEPDSAVGRRVQIQNARVFVHLSCLGTIALMPLLILPAMIGVLVDQSGMAESFAGWSASCNFFGAALVALLMSLRMHHLSLRIFATLGLSLAAIADLLSVLSTGWPTLFLAVRFLAGIGTGAAYTAALAAFARYEDTDRGYGIFITLQFIVSGLSLYLLPVYSSTLGTTGMFFILAGFDSAGVLLARYLPGKAIDERPEKSRASEMSVLMTTVAASALLGFCVFEAANTAQFTYIERLGMALQFGEHKVGTSLLIASFIGIPGAFAIVLMGERYGRLKPLFAGIGVAITGLVLLIVTDTYPFYLLANCCIGFSWAFCLPFIQGLLASLDRDGSVLAAGSFTATIGGAGGPGLAALFVGGGHYDRVFLMGIALFILAVISFSIANRETVPRAPLPL
jgi:MFS family permease